MFMTAEILRAVLIQKIKRDLSTRTDELMPHVDEIASLMCGVGDTPEENFDNAIVALTQVKNLSTLDKETVVSTVCTEVDKCVKIMESKAATIKAEALAVEALNSRSLKGSS